MKRGREEESRGGGGLLLLWYQITYLVEPNRGSTQVSKTKRPTILQLSHLDSSIVLSDELVWSYQCML